VENIWEKRGNGEKHGTIFEKCEAPKKPYFIVKNAMK